MRAEGKIKRDERVVAVLTGHVLKDPAAIIDADSSPTEIEPSLAALERALGE